MMISLQTPKSTQIRDVAKIMSAAKQEVEWASFRFVQEITHNRSARNEKPDQNTYFHDQGVMVEVFHKGHFAYAATSDDSETGILAALAAAKKLAVQSEAAKLFNFDLSVRPNSKGKYHSEINQRLDQMSLKEFSDLLVYSTKKMKVSDTIINRSIDARIVECHFEHYSTSGLETIQDFLLISSSLAVTAEKNGESITRTDHGSLCRCSQMGLEYFNQNFMEKISTLAGEQAVELSEAEICPTDTRDLILEPDMMMIQIHESIGHPLELDRILGDERNFAGWSFVKPSDFGQLQYGSKLMNATFNPTLKTQFATYAFDDCGNPSQKEFLIKDGVLQRGLGSLESQTRMQKPGVANFRAASWNRAPIDRMANINIEPGTTPLSEMIAKTEKGLLLNSHNSWSIDDYRDKFQFGAEYGRLIENGKLTKTVKRSNYRGRTVGFWNNLSMVGTAPEVEVYGHPFCGKGEPSQIIRVGHSSPPCLFKNIEIFGGK